MDGSSLIARSRLGLGPFAVAEGGGFPSSRRRSDPGGSSSSSFNTGDFPSASLAGSSLRSEAAAAVEGAGYPEGALASFGSQQHMSPNACAVRHADVGADLSYRGNSRLGVTGGEGRDCSTSDGHASGARWEGSRRGPSNQDGEGDIGHTVDKLKPGYDDDNGTGSVAREEELLNRDDGSMPLGVLNELLVSDPPDHDKANAEPRPIPSQQQQHGKSTDGQ